jgi:uncharacterized protein
MSSLAIQQIEDFAQPFMVAEVGHDFKHVDRVRNWALLIARQEGYADLNAVQAAALLHDIGLRDGGRRSHAEVGADLATAFLKGQGAFSDAQIAEIDFAIRFHSSLNGNSPLLHILQDADMLEMFGAVGIMRACMSKADWAEYDPANVKGETWGLTADDFTARFRSGQGVGKTVIDQINFQISCWDNLHTQTAKRIAKPMVDCMKSFVVTLESEIRVPFL